MTGHRPDSHPEAVRHMKVATGKGAAPAQSSNLGAGRCVLPPERDAGGDGLCSGLFGFRRGSGQEEVLRPLRQPQGANPGILNRPDLRAPVPHRVGRQVVPTADPVLAALRDALAAQPFRTGFSAARLVQPCGSAFLPLHHHRLRHASGLGPVQDQGLPARRCLDGAQTASAVVLNTVRRAKDDCICATPGRRVRYWRWMRAKSSVSCARIFSR